jgi:hypothetical protein
MSRTNTLLPNASKLLPNLLALANTAFILLFHVMELGAFRLIAKKIFLSRIDISEAAGAYLCKIHTLLSLTLTGENP